MNNWPKQSRAAMNAYYGCPDKNGDGAADAIWEAVNITRVVPPYPMVLAWNVKQPVSTIRVHRACSESLLRVLEAIKNYYGNQEALQQARLHLYGGCYNFRTMRGNPTALSTHSWGAAIDLDPAGNPFGGRVTMPQAVVDIFAKEGWVWGGTWRKPDGQHFQAATI